MACFVSFLLPKNSGKSYFWCPALKATWNTCLQCLKGIKSGLTVHMRYVCASVKFVHAKNRVSSRTLSFFSISFSGERREALPFLFTSCFTDSLGSLFFGFRVGQNISEYQHLVDLTFLQFSSCFCFCSSSLYLKSGHYVSPRNKMVRVTIGQNNHAINAIQEVRGFLLSSLQTSKNRDENYLRFIGGKYLSGIPFQMVFAVMSVTSTEE